MHNVGKTNRIHDHLLRIIRISFPSPRRKAINQTGRAKSVLSEREGPRGGTGRKSRTRRESTISLILPTEEANNREYSYDLHTVSTLPLVAQCVLCGCARDPWESKDIRPIFRGGGAGRGWIFAPRPRSGPCLPTRVYQILSPTKLCVRVRRHSSRLWNEFTPSLLEKEIVSYRSPLPFLPSFRLVKTFLTRRILLDSWRIRNRFESRNPYPRRLPSVCSNLKGTEK